MGGMSLPGTRLTKTMLDAFGVVYADGSTPFTGNVNLGNYDLLNVGNLRLVATTSSLGAIYVGGISFLHDYGGNLSLGENAGNRTMTGTENTLIGIQAGWSLTTGNQNIFLGAKCGDAITTSNGNVAVGAYAASGLLTGDNNVALGTGNMYAFSTGSNNVSIGSGAMAYATGSDNVAIGYWSGRVANGNGNVYIGNLAGRFATGSNKLYIANSSADPPLIFGDFSNGRIGLQTTSPTQILDINSDTLRLRTSRTPASAGAVGDQGDICWDSDYIYVCVAANTWKRAALSTW